MSEVATLPPSNKLSIRLLLIVLLSLGAMTAQSLPGDTDQPIRIAADTAVRDDRRGVTIYSGNVTMNQGSMRIWADKITVHNGEEEIDRIVARGKPARLEHQQETEKQPLMATGRQIEYFRSEERIRIREDAALEQEGSTVRSENIDYLIRDRLVKAEGGDSDITERVEVTIPPRSNPGQQERL